MRRNLPPVALSVRQPWAWAIIAGHKTIENRSLGAIRAGRMGPGKICLHAASGLSQEDYRWGVWRLARHGVTAPRPDDLVRGAIIGTVDVTGVITESSSEWFGGTAGLTLENAKAIEPIPCPGALGYFEWTMGGTFAPIKPWMRKWDPASADGNAPMLFDDLAPSFQGTPERPGMSRGKRS